MKHRIEASNVAIVGCGRIASHHCQTVTENPSFRLTAVCDLVESKAAAFATKYSVPFFLDYRSMLRTHPEIDIVVVASPSGMHYEHCMEFLEGYRKNVVVEKPTFLKTQQVRDTYRLARKLGVEVYPVFQNRFNKAVQRVHEAIHSKELGAIRLASVRVRWCRPQRYYDLAPWRGTYAMDGGALTNQGIHHLDLLRYLGGEIICVSAQMRTYGAQIEVEDAVVAHMEFCGGAIGSLEITTAARPIDFEASISLVCEHGLAQIGGIAVNELQIFTPKPDDCATFSEDFSGNVYGHGHATLYRSIADSRAKIRPYIIDETDCSGSISLLHAFYRSAALGAKVQVTAHEEFDRLGESNDSLAALYRVKQ